MEQTTAVTVTIEPGLGRAYVMWVRQNDTDRIWWRKRFDSLQQAVLESYLLGVPSLTHPDEQHYIGSGESLIHDTWELNDIGFDAWLSAA